MSNDLQNHAVAGLADLRDAALRIDWIYVGDWIERARRTIESCEASCEEKLKEVIGVCGGLSRGEWDRSLVDVGGLPYFAIFDVPIALYRYCETLDLESQRLGFVREQIGRLLRAREFHKAEQDAAGQPATRPESK